MSNLGVSQVQPVMPHGVRTEHLVTSPVVTDERVHERDERVLGRCRAMGLPVVVVMAGGYAREVSDTVEIHFRTVETAVRSYAGAGSCPAP